MKNKSDKMRRVNMCYPPKMIKDLEKIVRKDGHTNVSELIRTVLRGFIKNNTDKDS